MHAPAPGSAAPPLTAEPVAPAEFGTWRASVVAAYASDLATNGGLTAVQATRKAESDTASLLPDGVLTPGHEICWLRTVEAAGGGEPGPGTRVGRLWVAERTSHGAPILFVYDVAIDPPHRGRGYGRAAMLLAEEIARRRGLEEIGLNVFGGNTIARRLYRSLGYDERAVTMGKHLGAAGMSR
jgi:ribosomal protein S18 acetylase RimI-like enzyme